MVWRSRSLTHVHANPSILIVPLTLLQITFLPVSGDVHPTSLKSKKAAIWYWSKSMWISFFFACEHFSPSVCLSNPLSVLCVEATAVTRHFLGSHVCNLLKVGLVQGQLPLQLVAGVFQHVCRGQGDTHQVLKETACEASNTGVGSDWFCPQRTSKALRGIGNRHSQHSRHHSHHDSHHDSQHNGRFHRLGQMALRLSAWEWATGA